MWNKLYLAVLLVCVIVAGFFVYYGWSWLTSIGDPRIALENYSYHRGMGIYAMLISTALLIILGSVVLWVNGTAWALWVSEAYAVVFALILLVVLNAAANSYCLENNICQDPGRASGILLTVFGGLALSGVIFADQFLLLRLREKMYGRRDTEVATEKENSRDKDPES
jgi:hypothetical protein